MRLLHIWIVLIAFIANSSCAQKKYEHYRIYEVSDMDDYTRDYYTNDLRGTSPGIACGNFKTGNNVGCFKLLVRKKDGALRSLVYDDDEGTEKIYEIEYGPPSGGGYLVYIEKIYESQLEQTALLPGHKEVKLAKSQPSLQLNFFEKSAVVFYWKDDKFNEIWVSD